ncbi:MAG: polyprenyl synthetase family protein [Planctomycetes bacterium]|nr:polyprenyl synthetase family protein [Planctomycetota bacterium]
MSVDGSIAGSGTAPGGAASQRAARGASAGRALGGERVRLTDLTALIAPELLRVNRELAADLSPEQPELTDMLDLATSYRGKQLRPVLVLLSGRAVGELTDAHVTVAKIVELLHTATLVHDDVLDGASIRRRQATVNAAYGTEVPVLLGDYIYAKAFHMSVALDDPTCSRVLAEATRRICQGEITQIVHRFDFEWDEARYYDVITDKTALLYACACRLGGHYAGARGAMLDALERYGMELGVSFQIVDDCLDLDGDEEVVGKSLGTDLGKGKLTLPLLHMMRDPAVRTRLEALMCSELGEADKLAALRRDFPLEAGLDYARDAAAQRVQRAVDALDVLAATPARDAMRAMADYVLARRR